MVYYDIVWAFATVLDTILKREPTFADKPTMGFMQNLTRLSIMAKEFEKLDFQGASVRIQTFLLLPCVDRPGNKIV